MDTNVNIGEIVQLKSGGPVMSVIGYGNGTFGNLIICNWFANDLLQQDIFPEQCLNIVNKATPKSR